MPICIVNAKLNSHKDQKPSFSCTAIYGNHFGMIHDVIEEHYPNQYTDIIALHLSDIDGVPMYAVENGYYFLCAARGKEQTEYTYKTVAKHLRITEAEAEALAPYNRAMFEDFVEAQKPRWKQEADACILKHNLLA